RDRNVTGVQTCALPILALSEKQIQEFLSNLYTKLADDEELAEMLSVEFMASTTPEEGEQFISDFNETLREAAEDVKEQEFPDGLTSTVWTNDDHIVKRDFNASFVDS